jgi:hypothetical protein
MNKLNEKKLLSYEHAEAIKPQVVLGRTNTTVVLGQCASLKIATVCTIQEYI